jgi:hypothetical protein
LRDGERKDAQKNNKEANAMKQYTDIYDILNDGKLSAVIVYYSDDKRVKGFNWVVKFGDIIIMSGSCVEKNKKLYWHTLELSGFYRAIMIYNLMPDAKQEELLSKIRYMGERIMDRRVLLDGNKLRVQDAITEIVGYECNDQ